jgi:lysophospholipase L1-like esterase
LTVIAQPLDSSTNITAKDGSEPTPYPKNEAAWPGTGVIRVFPWMTENRKFFWSERLHRQGSIVFAGDSLVGGWSNLQSDFSGIPVTNRGIGGDVSRGLLFRFKEDVLDLHPKGIVILIGTNDLSTREKPEVIIENIERILTMTEHTNPELKVILCTLPPRNNPQASIDPGELQELNRRIKRLTTDHKNLTVLDLYSLLADRDGLPHPEDFKPDQLHLGQQGHGVWRDSLIPLFARLGMIKKQ